MLSRLPVDPFGYAQGRLFTAFRMTGVAGGYGICGGIAKRL